MSEAKRRFFSGPSVERAVLDAAAYYGVDPEELAYEKVEKSSGFTKRRKTVIKVDPEAPTGGGSADRPAARAAERPPRAEEPSADEAVAEEDEDDSEEPRGDDLEDEADDGDEDEDDDVAEDEEDDGEDQDASLEDEDDEEVAAASDRREGRARGSRGTAGRTADPSPGEVASDGWASLAPTGEGRRLPRARGRVQEVATRWMGEILELGRLDAKATIYGDEEELLVDLQGPDRDLLVDDGGQLLGAVQVLLPRLMQKDLEGRIVPVDADSGAFREHHEERLRSKAVEAAEKARSEGQRVTLDPMPPGDRRTVHLALADDPAVETESLGRGYFKRVAVYRV